MLHQLEQSLAEVLDQLTSVGVEAIARPHVGEGVSGVGGDELKVTVARLKKKLQHNEETRHIELQESKVGYTTSSQHMHVHIQIHVQCVHVHAHL